MSTTENKTLFEEVYNRFLSKITDDMYMEISLDETIPLLEDLLINAIPWFEFPRVNLNSYTLTEFDIDEESGQIVIISGTGQFNIKLSIEEINILATYMVVGWLDQQLASVEVTRMKYSGSDFKMTSQANHMAKLLTLKKDFERAGMHLQRLYKRRKTLADGSIVSNMGSLMRTSARTGRVPSPSETRPNGDPIGWEDIVISISDKKKAMQEAYTWRNIAEEYRD